MSLETYQRAFVRASLAAEPASDDLERVGAPERFLLYRQMIRNRLRQMAMVAFKESSQHAGQAALSASFDRFLDRAPPSSPLLREVVSAFGSFARGDLQLLREAPAYLPDLLLYEETKWRVAYVAGRPPRVGEDGVRELDFEGALVLNPSLTQLSLSYPVHRLASLQMRPDPTSLLIYRPLGSDALRWYATSAFFATVLAQARDTGAALADVVRRAAAQRRLAVDQRLLELLSSELTTALSRSVVVGVREVRPPNTP